MKIKKLEISGFKSFADGASLNFGQGISGVVGPNGCGKSNIVDAIRWCMGEMSAKHLRGRGMQDVIFAGSDSRGPMGMAEVTLTFHNDGNAPPQYNGFTDIAVTRRLFRDGTSEYLINKVQARLRDITDLFLGTGVGTRAYSIIEQGRIGFIVSSRPEDRRTLIEEVAGITKFKMRKKAAERRLEATEQNLLRVNDIVGELERQLNSLKRQAKKAARYKELKDELRDLELHAASLEYLRLAGAEKVQHSERQKLEEGIRDAQTGLTAEEAELEAVRLRLIEEEERLQKEQVRSSETDAKLAALERDLEHWQTQLQQNEQQFARSTQDLVDAERKSLETSSERSQKETELVAVAAQLNDDRQKTSTLEEELARTQHQLSQVEHAIEHNRNQALEHVHGAAQQRTRAESLVRQRSDLRQRLVTAQQEKTDLGGRKELAQTKYDELQTKINELQNELNAWREKQTTTRDELAMLQNEARQSEARVRELQGQVAQRRSRLVSLEQIAQQHEGYSDGVRNLLAAKERQELSGEWALLAEIVQVDSEYEKAIEAALGEKLQTLLANDFENITEALRFLQTTQGGRGALMLKTDTHAEPRPSLEGAVRALDVVRAPEEYRDVLMRLFRDLYIVSDLEQARHCHAQFGNYTFVTRDGEVFDRDSVVSGGSQNGAGLLQQQREIRELHAWLEEHNAQLEQLTSAHASLESRRLQTEVDIQQLGKDIHANELELLETQKDYQASQDELTRYADRLLVLQYELEQRQNEIATIDQEEEQANKLAKESEGQKSALEAVLADLQQQRTALSSQVKICVENLTGLRVTLATHEEKERMGRAEIERLHVLEQELRTSHERNKILKEQAQRAIAELKERLASGSASSKELAVVAQEQRDALSQARKHYEHERSGTMGVEQSLREKRRGTELQQEALAQLKMDVQRLQMEREKLLEQMAERHDVDLLRIMGDYHLRPLPDAETTARREELDRSIKAMGPINLAAIEECSEVETRHTFLVKQRDDLTTAVDSLRRAISRINRMSRERFLEAFEAVNTMFKQVFPRLFRGGEARLELVESEDLLEAGVEIIAQPPGKKLQSVGLLSGGEKALTATALVFAIFLIKPSPFCILDEVDAPLDEANVGRFNEMLKEISKISQFIVITHNKQTMSSADRLYGITMEEPGMSKVVSVDLEERKEAAA